MGFIDGIFIDGIMGVGRVVIDAISSVGSSVLRAVGSFAKDIIMTPFPPIFPGIEIALKLIVCAIGSVAELLTKKPEEEKPEELGYKAKVAADEGKKPEDFNSTNEYIEYLRNNIKVEEELLHELKDEERAAYAAVGAGLYVKQVEEKYGVELPPKFWRSAASLQHEGKITEEMPADLIAFMKEKGIKSGEALPDFISGQLEVGSEEQKNMYDALKDTYRKEYPEATEGELNRKISSLRKSSLDVTEV